MSEKKTQELIAQLIATAQEIAGENTDARSQLEQLKKQIKDPPPKSKKQSRGVGHTPKRKQDHVTELPEGWTIKTVKPVGNPKKLNSRQNPTQGIRKRRVSQKAKTSTRPARRTVKSQSTTSTQTKSSKVVSQADKKVTCQICGKKVMFRNLSKHRKKDHPKEVSASAKKGAQVRITTSSRSVGVTQDTLQRMEALKRQVNALNKRSK